MKPPRRTYALSLLLLCLASPLHAAPSKATQIGWAEGHLRAFEAEVARAGGGSRRIWREKDTALRQVQELCRKYPEDPEVKALYRRASLALKKSKGDFIEILPAMIQYLENENRLRSVIADESRKAWNKLLASHSDIITRIFPSPDYRKVEFEDLEGKYILLSSVLYPRNQFYGGTGEYIHHGKPSSGYYYIDIGGRDWLGPYEAVKRFRRMVDTSLEDVTEWTVLGRITGITSEIPQAEKTKTGSFHTGWVVTPEALYVPGHCMAYYDANHENSGQFTGEKKVAEIKDSWYSYRTVPGNVTADGLMTIFMTAIKEKNHDLFIECIDPTRREEAADLQFHWDKHQRRFHGEYVHATFSKPEIKVIKGLDDDGDFETFFLNETDLSSLKKAAGDKVEEAVLKSRAWDKNGKAVGSPKPHILRRTNGGRWYVHNYPGRF